MREVRSYARGTQGGKRVGTPVKFRPPNKPTTKRVVVEAAPDEIDWSNGKCKNGDPDAMFVQGNPNQTIAKRICRDCPIKMECLADALDNRIEFGVWGGMTERERRALLRRHPQVTSWRQMFLATMRKSTVA